MSGAALLILLSAVAGFGVVANTERQEALSRRLLILWFVVVFGCALIGFLPNGVDALTAGFGWRPALEDTAVGLGWGLGLATSAAGGTAVLASVARGRLRRGAGVLRIGLISAIAAFLPNLLINRNFLPSSGDAGLGLAFIPWFCAALGVLATVIWSLLVLMTRPHPASHDQTSQSPAPNIRLGP